ncbi:hypothetical protein B0A49_02232 [Cryomyces minteri]|uniref:Phosphotransferase n=1 Tax=Cryomyces minteri TaxID=331657 RepID=A0A4U0XLR2_9PEZI|nr:hypothetical protein B0A49_02232 [Cryomyces minteri]
MDEFLREVQCLFEAPLQPANLHALSGKLQQQFRQKLQSSNICMLPSYNHTLPTGHERGTYLALDVGGSTFRVALVELGGKERGNQGMQITRMRSFRIDNAERALKGHAFFDWMADRIQDTLAEEDYQLSHGTSALPMGLAWSFPVEQTSIRSGKLLAMGKGFCATHGVAGQDLGSLIMHACRRKNLNVRMDAIVNDSSATLLSQAYNDPSTRLALILGTGTNAAIHLPVSVLGNSKFGNRPQSWYEKADHVIVNTELSMFGKNILPTTRWDDYLNITHMNPDFQPLEHLIGGRYLGEIVRLILLEAIQTAGLFGGEVPEQFINPYTLDTGTIAAIESDTNNSLSQSSTILQKLHPLRTPPSRSDMLFVRKVCQLVSHRAAAYLATGAHALYSLRTAAEGLKPKDVGHVTIACNGTVIEKYPEFRPLCQQYLDDLTELSGAPRSSVVLEMTFESAIYGAAVAVCCLEDQ